MSGPPLARMTRNQFATACSMRGTQANVTVETLEELRSIQGDAVLITWSVTIELKNEQSSLTRTGQTDDLARLQVMYAQTIAAWDQIEGVTS